VAVLAPPLLVLDAVSKRYQARGRSVLALDNVSLTVNDGAFVTIVGPSGCGKSTLLNLISGLERIDTGAIRFRGAPVRTGDRRIGYVTQQDNLFPWRTLRDNIVFPLTLASVPPQEAARRAAYWIEKVGLAGFEDAYPHELSGGMRQRGNIARTLIYQPDLIMMDEPFGPLDAQTRLQLQKELLRIWQETKVSVLFITHDLAEAVALSSEVAIMSARPGKIEAIRDVPLSYPRDIARLHDNSSYRTIYDDLWERLERVVDAAQERQRGDAP
jgi:ABC-type nitrate/sulfonate/bicarbonate transport system ATPase subunit